VSYPTGNDPQSDTLTLTATIPYDNDGIANDFLLDAILGSLFALTNPASWNDAGYTVTAAQAAAMAQTVYDGITLT
jgi:hypothetical protein